ncbi:zinc finger CCCH domain-containing protein 39 isoform X2 [Punica granatum]|uniref:Zinc finger CCCH domain-containing protein 39 isoform X2 n=3 Tax=Punica granatum TaxID=22663 RepID=A0A6P8BXC7_PUNGR|nr:zinc finger CCCH domain-containing protein 39 isoform X2 [Punica granatum]
MIPSCIKLELPEMSLSDPSPHLMPPASQHFGDSAAYWAQFPMSNEQFDPTSQFDFDHPQPPLKRPRNFEESPSNSAPYPRPNPPINKGATNIFFKTRMCAKFKMGTCRNGENCNFAHGIEDMRQPPPNWQELVGAREDDHRSSDNWDDDQKIIHKMKLCKKFYNGEECPYGDRCNFLHEGPSKFRDDSGRFRETSAICIGTSGTPMGHRNGSNQSEVWRAASSSVDPRVNMKPVYWKTKLCTKFEVTGDCPFGDKCHFAHGIAELQSFVGRVEDEQMNIAPIAVKSQPIFSSDPSSIGTSVVAPAAGEGQAKKSLLKWKGNKKINQIYADWLSDSPLLQNTPSKPES